MDHVGDAAAAAAADGGEVVPGLAWRAAIGDDGAMDALTEGQKVWVEQADGSQRAAIFVGEAEASWFGGSPGAYVVYPDTRDGQEVELMRIIAREDDAGS